MAISITLHPSAAGACSLTPCTTILRLLVPSTADSSIGYLPVHSPLLRESQLFSCPPLNDPLYLPDYIWHSKTELRWPEGVDCTLSHPNHRLTHTLPVVEADTPSQSISPADCLHICIGYHWERLLTVVFAALSWSKWYHMCSLSGLRAGFLQPGCVATCVSRD